MQARKVQAVYENRMSTRIAFRGSVSDVVLIVEDEYAARTGMEQILHRAGYAPVSAPNGQAALDPLRPRVPARGILLDLLMPVMDGWAFPPEQPPAPPPPPIPVIAV